MNKNKFKKFLTCLLFGLLFLPNSLIIAQTDFAPEGMSVIGSKGVSYYTRKVATSIGIYTKNGVVPGVKKFEGTWGGVKYNALEVDVTDTNGTFIQVDYAGKDTDDLPKYLNNFFDSELTKNDDYYWVGAINAGFFDATSTSSMYGYPVGAVKIDGSEESYSSSGTSNSPWKLSPSYGTGFVTAHLNKNQDFKLIYNGWKNGNFYKYINDPSPNSWEYGEYDNYQDAVSGAYTLMVNGDTTINWGKGDYTGTDYWNYSGTCVTLFGQKENGNFILLTTEGTLNATSQVALMKNLGCVDAIRFDGGGSTQMTFDKGLIVDHFYISKEQNEILEGEQLTLDDLSFDIYDGNGSYHWAMLNDIPQAEVQILDSSNQVVEDITAAPAGTYYIKVLMNGLEQQLPITVKANNHNVTFDLNYDGAENEVVEVHHNDKVTPIEDPIREGFIFKGWFTEDGNEFDFNSPILQDLKLIAKWEERAIVDYVINNTKDTYFVGDTLDSSTITIEAIYNDDTKEEIDTTKYEFIIPEDAFLQANEVEITVRLKETQEDIGSFMITVKEPQLLSIEAKLVKDIFINDIIDGSYFEITGNLENEKTINIDPSECMISEVDTTESKDIQITISYDDLEYVINAFVHENIPVVSQNIKDINVNQIININESIETIELILEDDSTMQVDTFNIDGFDNTSGTKQNITISFDYYDSEMNKQHYSKELNVFVKDYTSIYATKDVIEYYLDEELNTDDIHVYKILENAQTFNSEPIELDKQYLNIDVSDVNREVPDTYPIHLSYTMNDDPYVQEQLDDIYVTFKERLNLPEHPSMINDMTLINDNKFVVNDNVNVANLSFNATLEDGTTIDINTNDLVISNFDLSSAGKKIMNISYEYQINGNKKTFNKDIIYYVLNFNKLSLNNNNYVVDIDQEFNYDNIHAYLQLGDIQTEISKDKLRFDPTTIDTSYAGIRRIKVYYYDDITEQEYLVGTIMVNVNDPNEDITNKKGSITLYKYQSQDGKYIQGNFQNQDTSSISDKPIQGVGFKYVKIGDLYQIPVTDTNNVGLYYSLDEGFLSELNNYGITLDPVIIDDQEYYTTEVINEALNKMNTSEQAYDNANDGSMIPTERMLRYIDQVGIAMPDTDENGETFVADLDQGLYLIGEYKQPTTDFNGVNQSLSRPSAPFLMPIPTTNISDYNGNVAGSTWIYDLVAYPKSEMIVIRKDIIADGNDINDAAEDSNGLVQQTDKNIGDYVNFLLTADVPALQPQVTDVANKNRKYIITDKMSDGLTIDSYNADNFTVKLGTDAYNSDTLTVLEHDIDYTVTSIEDSNGFILTLTEAGLNKFDTLNTDSKLYINYKARLNENAADPKGSIKFETNDYSLTYGTSVTKDHVFESNKDIRTYTYEIDIQKQFNEEISDMSAVTFSVAHIDPETNNETIINFVKDDDGNYHVFDGKESSQIVSEINVASDGQLILRGLDAGKYAIKELSTIKGYNLLKEPIILSITADSPENGQLTTVTVKQGNEEINIGDGLNNGCVQFIIKNNETISALYTGGSGWNKTLYIVGLITIGASVYVIYKHKKNKNGTY